MYIVKLNPKIFFICYYFLKKSVLCTFFCTANWTLPMYVWLSKAITRSKISQTRELSCCKSWGYFASRNFSKKNIEPVILRHRTREDQDHTTKVCVFFMLEKCFTWYLLLSTSTLCLIRHNYLHPTPDLLRILSKQVSCRIY